jgi:transposase-like protein
MDILSNSQIERTAIHTEANHERLYQVSYKVVTRISNIRTLTRFSTQEELSEKAKFRLKVFDWYYQKSAALSNSGKADVSITCRHFGIHRSYFYRWMARFNKRRLSSLENKSTAPKNPRLPAYSRDFAAKVRKIRENDQTYSALKIRPILSREMSEADIPGTAGIGRLIKRENLFFRPDVIRQLKKHSKAVKTAHERKRKPYNLRAGTDRGKLSSSI